MMNVAGNAARLAMRGSVRPHPPSAMKRHVRVSTRVCRGGAEIEPPGKRRSVSMPRKTVAWVAVARVLVRDGEWAEKWWPNLATGE